MANPGPLPDTAPATPPGTPTVPSLRRLTHGRVLHIAVPVVISNATVPILGAVDTGVVGQIGEAAPIGAVGIGAVILSAIYWLFGFLRMGTAGLVAQARGRGDLAEVAAMLTRVLLIGGGAGLLFILLQIPIFHLAFRFAPASAEVEAMARDYLSIRVLSAPAAIAIFGLTGWLVAHERTRAMLVLQLWMNGLNIGLDVLFVLRLGWGVEGVAIATVIAEYSGLALGVWIVRGGFAEGHWRNWAQVFDRAILWRMASLNTDILIRSLLLEAGFLSFIFLGAGMGDVTLAANQVLLQFLFITAHALDGFAFAAEALVGQAMGARNRDGLRRAVAICAQWTAGTMAALALAFWLGGNAIVALMTTSAEVRLAAAGFLPWMVAAPIIGGPSWLLDGIFIGATRGRDMRNMMAVSFAAYLVALWAFMPWGNHGLWAAQIVFFAARGVTLALRYPALEKDLGPPVRVGA